MHKVSVHALHEMPDGTMRWEEVDTLGDYSVFEDCAGRSAIACADAAGCGTAGEREVEEGRGAAGDWSSSATE